MTTKDGRIDIGGIPVDVVRKDIKNLHVGVYPPDGRVRVAAPRRLDDKAVQLAVISRLGWIHRKRAEFDRQDRQSPRELVTGESHYFQGRRYRLDVSAHDGRPCVSLQNKTTMALRIRPGSDRDKRDAALQQWYRARLRDQLSPLVAKWERRVGVRVAAVRIRKMKTRWGSCNAKEGRIWLNLELAKKSPLCLEYIVVHEMVHLQERHHNERFQELMDTVMPLWRQARDELNQAPLAHEEWQY